MKKRENKVKTKHRTEYLVDISPCRREDIAENFSNHEKKYVKSLLSTKSSEFNKLY